MDKKILLVAAGLFGLAMLLLTEPAAVSLAAFGRAATAESWAAWVQAVGSVAAILATLYVPMRERRQAKLDAEKVALMVIATELRNWLERCSEAVSETMTYALSNGARGTRHSTLEVFPFEEDLGQIAKLDHAHATALFGLIHRKNDANASVEKASNWLEEYGVIEEFCGCAPEIYMLSFEIYSAFIAELGWARRIDDEVLAGMRARAENYVRRREEFSMAKF
ncbi:MAG: hypothetical protein H7Z12_02025 [Rhodospirillaceae bacterium]|nr:hypothetical protein [Rhodospirillales bacterium]